MINPNGNSGTVVVDEGESDCVGVEVGVVVEVDFGVGVGDCGVGVV